MVSEIIFKNFESVVDLTVESSLREERMCLKRNFSTISDQPEAGGNYWNMRKVTWDGEFLLKKKSNHRWCQGLKADKESDINKKLSSKDWLSSSIWMVTSYASRNDCLHMEINLIWRGQLWIDKWISELTQNLLYYRVLCNF